MTIEERFWAKVDRRGPDECWPWLGALTAEGYGNLDVPGTGRRGRRTIYAHRFAYELLVGPIPKGLTIDHYDCRNRACQNPAHMEPVTRAENTRRGSVRRWALARA